MGLSTIDLRLLRFAVQHGLHFSRGEIGRKLRLSPSTVNYSTNRLLNANVITGFRYKLDYRKIGLEGLAWVLFSVKRSEENQRRLIKELLSYPEVHVAAFISGEKDIALKVIDRDVHAINRFILTISEKFSKEIQEPLVLFSTQQFKAHNVCVEPSPKPLKLDSIDLALLDKKMVAPNLTLGEIAKELSIHKNTVSRRWRKLRRGKIVLKKSLYINPDYYSAIGIALKALVLFDVAPAYRERFISMMRKLPAVHELHSLLSGPDFLSIVRTAGIPEFYSFISKVCSNGENRIERTISHVFLRIESHPPNYLSELKKQGTISF